MGFEWEGLVQKFELDRLNNDGFLRVFFGFNHFLRTNSDWFSNTQFPPPPRSLASASWTKAPVGTYILNSSRISAGNAEAQEHDVWVAQSSFLFRFKPLGVFLWLTIEFFFAGPERGENLFGDLATHKNIFPLLFSSKCTSQKSQKNAKETLSEGGCTITRGTHYLGMHLRNLPIFNALFRLSRIFRLFFLAAKQRFPKEFLAPRRPKSLKTRDTSSLMFFVCGQKFIYGMACK